MAVDFYLKIDGIKGESADAQHKDQIQVQSWSWGESNPASVTSGKGLSAGKVNMQDFSFTLVAGKASADLMKACATGAHIKDAVLSCRKAGGAGEAPQQDYYVFTFGDLVVSSFQTGGSGGGDEILESCTIAFSQVKVEYKIQDAKGVMANAGNMEWSQKTNTPKYAAA